MRKDVAIATREGKWVVNAAIVAPGIALHRVLGPNNAPYSDWTLTHISTGKRIVGPFRLRKQAVACAERLAQITDWTQDELGILVVPELGARVRNTYSQMEHR